MKTAFISLALGFGLVPSVFAADVFTPFTTIDQARVYCPAENTLSFKANNSGSNSAGIITGTNQKVFSSFPGKVTRPKNLNQNIITDAQFRNDSGNYGYISGPAITCFYSYTTFNNARYSLVLRSR